MKIFEHLLKNSYAFLLAFCLIFLIGPKFINISRNKQETTQDNQISKLRLDFLNPNVITYLTFETELNKKTFKISFKKEDNQYSDLIIFFQKSSNKNNFDLPIVISDSVLNKINSSRIELGDKDELTFLKLNDYVLIGKERTYFGRFVLFAIGIAFIIIGTALATLTILAINNSIKAYKKTGKLPSLVNSIDEMINGWKIILGKKNNNSL